ncbi:BglG family transcription antiterminator [Vagococcus zengguangii]|uniref:BglG family transcription antiterminator n=1 Tax=Vagococcus zengguangii TaxID=2571750 RepID=UPI0012B0627C|nr:PTS sugar transporter subunit IIA [Vagococcus zengguangii]
MDNKHINLINLLKKSNQPITSNELALKLNISSRTVKNYVKEINSGEKVPIIISSNNGYQLNSIDVKSPEEKHIPQTYSERSKYVISQLIFNQLEAINIFDLCEDLFLSYSSIKSLINKMNTSYTSHNVSFRLKKNLVYFKGKEEDKRKFISFIITDNLSIGTISKTQLTEIFPRLDIDACYSIIKHELNENNYYINDFAMINIVTHLLIMIDRKQQGNNLVLLEDDNTNSIDSSFLSFIDEIEKKFDIHFSYTEIDILYNLFSCNVNYVGNKNIQLEDVIDKIGKKTYTFTKNIIKKINSIYLIDLNNNEFIFPFALHIKNLITRIKNTTSSNINPLKNIIKSNNPIIFEIATHISLLISDEYKIKIPEEEISFIAMHIGGEMERVKINESKIPTLVICPNYNNLDNNLTSVLYKHFENDIDIKDTFTSENELQVFFNNIPNSQKFLLLSTIPLSKTTNNGNTLVLISPFNIQDQMFNILNGISQYKDNTKNQLLVSNFDKFFSPNLFFNFDTYDMNLLITKLCANLVEHNLVDTNFEHDVFIRENMSSTSFGKIAIPHSIHMNAAKTSISVCISKKGMKWGDNVVNIIFLLAINQQDYHIFRNLYESLINVFTFPSTIEQAKKCSTLEEFKEIILRSLNK